MKILNRLFTAAKVEAHPTQNTGRPLDFKKKITHYTKEEEKINALFAKHNKPLTKETLGEVKLFLSKTEGPMTSKLETIDLSLAKGIGITADNLSAVHEALIGDLEEVLKAVDLRRMDFNKVYASLPEKFKSMIDHNVKAGLDFETAVKDLLVSVFKNMFSGERLSLGSRPRSNFEFEETKGSIFFELDEKLHATAVSVEDKNMTLSGSSPDEELPPVRHKKLEADQETIKLIEEALEAVEGDIGDLLDALDGNIDMGKVAEFQSENSFKKIIKREITEKMVELKNEFNTYKNSIGKQLESFIDDKAVVLNMKDTLNSVIDKLDALLMKSEITLHTDMKTERDLLASSSKLDDARVLLDQNKSKAAIEIVKAVKDIIEAIDFKPALNKVYGVSQKMFMDKLYDQQILTAVPLNITTDPQTSPRAVLELLRGMGLNHETEVSELVNKEKTEDGSKYTQNMKTMLMKLEEDATKKVAARQGLENLTGQQLMNKLEYKAQKQKMLFNMPIKIDKTVKNLKIHVNAKKDNQKIDWKNSTLYFVVQLDKLGDTGILVDINNGQVNITIKNDSTATKEKIQPILQGTIKRFEALGFHTYTIKYDALNNHKAEVKRPMKEEMNKEGFDFKI